MIHVKIVFPTQTNKQVLMDDHLAARIIQQPEGILKTVAHLPSNPMASMH